MAAALSGEGYLVAVPEVYHEFEPPGTVLAYDEAGSERGNALKYTKEIASTDEDAAVVVSFLASHPRSTGKVGSYGVCLGGHLAIRAALEPLVRATGAFYPTDLHSSTLGLGKSDDTLQRLGEAGSPFLLLFGRQDPHVPEAGRRAIYDRFRELDLTFEWHEFNAAHAFLRDEGPRYNPALARVCHSLLLRFFAEHLGAG